MRECKKHKVAYFNNCPGCLAEQRLSPAADSLPNGGIIEIDPPSYTDPDQALIEALQDIATAFNRVADAIERYGEEK